MFETYLTSVVQTPVDFYLSSTKSTLQDEASKCQNYFFFWWNSASVCFGQSPPPLLCGHQGKRKINTKQNGIASTQLQKTLKEETTSPKFHSSFAFPSSPCPTCPTSDVTQPDDLLPRLFYTSKNARGKQTLQQI